MSRLAIGTAQFGLSYGIANQSGQVNRSEARGMLQYASENGIDTIDTAIAYGESEQCLGEIGTQSFKLVTKLPALDVNCSNVGDWVQSQVEESLKRLNTQTLYGLLLHKPKQLISSQGTLLFKALHDLKESGVVYKIGISVYSPEELDLLIPKYKFDLVQAPFNLVDRRLRKTNWLDRLKQDGIEIHTRSVFLQGILLMSADSIPPKFEPWKHLWSSWHEWLETHDESALQACLSFPLSTPEIDKIVVGADNLRQLSQIITATGGAPIGDLPNLECDDEHLINPATWFQP